jgi:hypothetical protein
MREIHGAGAAIAHILVVRVERVTLAAFHPVNAGGGGHSLSRFIRNSPSFGLSIIR